MSLLSALLLLGVGSGLAVAYRGARHAYPQDVAAGLAVALVLLGVAAWLGVFSTP